MEHKIEQKEKKKSFNTNFLMQSFFFFIKETNAMFLLLIELVANSRDV